MILLLTVLLTQKTESPPPSTPSIQPTGFMRNMGGMMNRGARA